MLSRFAALDSEAHASYITNQLINQEVNIAPHQLDAVFSALADSTRRAILGRLALGQASVTELAQPFEMSLPAITKHLKVLEGAGLITRSRQAQWRPCQLAPQPLHEVAEWVEQYRQFWESNLSNLDDYLRELQAAEPNGTRSPSEPQPTSKPQSEGEKYFKP